MLNKTAGRPRGNPNTKARITAAARELFLKHGYPGTTVRAIAAAAGVDSAFISYHFGSKQGLFSQSLDLLCVGSHSARPRPAGDREHLADRLLDSVTGLWDAAGPVQSRMAVQDDDTMRALRTTWTVSYASASLNFSAGPTPRDVPPPRSACSVG